MRAWTPGGGVLAAGFAALCMAIGGAFAVAQETPEAAKDDPRPSREDFVPRAEALIADHDCLACHADERGLRKALDSRQPPRLAGVSGRVDPDWMRRFLEDPRSERPGTRHPHQLVALPEASRPQVALDLVHFLAREDDARPIERTLELSDVAELEGGRALFHSVGCVVCHGPQEAADDLLVSLAAFQSGAAERGVPGEDDGATSGEGGHVGTALEPHVEPLPVDLARKQSLSQLAAFLADPVAVRPGGHCPSMSLSGGEARAIAAYLLREQVQRADGSFEVAPGLLRREYLIEESAPDDIEAATDGLEPHRTAAVATVELGTLPREDQFALRFTGWLDVPAEGNYTFHLTSDDGSILTVDGVVAVENGGRHPATTKSGTIELFGGPVTIDVGMMERAGDQALALEWEGPGLERQPIDPERLTHWPLRYSLRTPSGVVAEREAFTVDQARADRGARAFLELGCATCHAEVGDAVRDRMRFDPPVIEPEAVSLRRMGGVRPGVLVCLRPGGRFELAPEDTGALLAAFLDPGSIGRDAMDTESTIHRTMVRRNCYGCHQRGDIGGVHPSLEPYFIGDEVAELGDQSRFPPTLTAVGRKLRPEVLVRAVHGESRVRPYLAVRMPRVGDGHLDTLAETLAFVDRVQGAGTAGADVPPCSAPMLEDGRRLAGIDGGLGCVQCHDFRGTPGLGIRAVDLGTMHGRLRPEWFRELLLDPSSVGLEGRMASLWVDGQSPIEDIAGGDIEAQIQALWCWLGEGDEMAPPPGLHTGPWAFEVTPSGDRPRLVSVFMEGVSPRVLCFGTTDGVHGAFDLRGGRLAKVWRGRFMNAMGTWSGRAGALERPGSQDVADLPPGPAVASVESLVAPWPAGNVLASLPRRSLGRTAHGDGSVTFRYAVGELTVAETIRPAVLNVPEGATLGTVERSGVRRVLEVRAPAGGAGRPVMARLLTGRLLEPAGRGAWRPAGSSWPLVQVDPETARTARIVAPEARSGPAGGGAIDLDSPRRRREDMTSVGTAGPRGAGEELRIPLLLLPAGDGSGELVGRLSWSYTW